MMFGANCSEPAQTKVKEILEVAVQHWMKNVLGYQHQMVK
jgi:hypothetical protein